MCRTPHSGKPFNHSSPNNFFAMTRCWISLVPSYLPVGLARRASGFAVLARSVSYPAGRPRLQLDHALGRGPLPPVRCSWVRREAVSDHLALSVELGLSSSRTDPRGATR